MKKYSNETYKLELAKAKRLSKQKELNLNIKNERNRWRESKPKLEMSKKLAIYLFLLLNVIVIYCFVAMWHFADLTYLGVLITDIAAQILIYGIYCLKAYKAKKSEENVKLQREKMQGLDEIIQADAEENTENETRAGMGEY